MGKFPPEAKRVFKGVIFDVYQWEQTLYDDTSTATFEVLKRIDSTVAIGIKDNKILIAHDRQPNRQPVVTLIGGSLDEGEAVLDGAKREFLEESGHASEHWEELFVLEPSDVVDWRVHFFIAHDIHKVAEPEPGPGELIELQWVTFEEFLQISKLPNFQNRDLAVKLYGMNAEELEQFRQRLFASTPQA